MVGALGSVQWTAPARSLRAGIARGGRASRAREGVRVVAARPPKGENDGSDNKPKKMLYEVKVVTPPERSLGPHMLPKNTHCGDTIELKLPGWVQYAEGKIVEVHWASKGFTN